MVLAAGQAAVVRALQLVHLVLAAQATLHLLLHLKEAREEQELVLVFLEVAGVAAHLPSAQLEKILEQEMEAQELPLPSAEVR